MPPASSTHARRERPPTCKVGDEVVVHCRSPGTCSSHWVHFGRGSHVRPSFSHLGLRDQLVGSLRAVHARAGPPVPADRVAPPPHLREEAAVSRTDSWAPEVHLPHALLLAAARPSAKTMLVLVWGGSSVSLGSMAIQERRRPRCSAPPKSQPPSSPATAKGDLLRRNSAPSATSTRKNFSHWGRLPVLGRSGWHGRVRQGLVLDALRSRNHLEEHVARRSCSQNPRIVFEHPEKRTTLPRLHVRLRHRWHRVVIERRHATGVQRRCRSLATTSGCARQSFPGLSHFANDEQAGAFNDLVLQGKINPCLSRVFPFEDDGGLPPAHVTAHGEPPYPRCGNMTILVGSHRCEGQGRSLRTLTVGRFQPCEKLGTGPPPVMPGLLIVPSRI